MKRGAFDDLRRALGDPSAADELTTAIRVDGGRRHRSGVPEVVYAGPKTPQQVVESLRRLATASGRAIASRCTTEMLEEVKRAFASTPFEVHLHPEARGVVIADPEHPMIETGGRVGILTAGSSDAPVAAEAALIAREMGCNVFEARDMGVAGLHRLVAPLEQMLERDVDVLVVVAGMDGVLPSVVSGLVSLPIVGIPTSTGYGYGGDGVGALTTMLQTCAPGLSVVNIDNGIGGGASAALIANRAAAQRIRS